METIELSQTQRERLTDIAYMLRCEALRIDLILLEQQPITNENYNFWLELGHLIES